VSDGEVEGMIDRLFGSSSGRYGPYRRLGKTKELVPDTYYSVPVVSRAVDASGNEVDDQELDLQLYLQLSSLGGQLWEQELRVLLKVSALCHPALPTVTSGNYDEDDHFAFTTTHRNHYDLQDRSQVASLRDDQPEAFRQLSSLADGLALLHGQRLMHRNLWPATVQISLPDDSKGSPALRLARFEMSSLVGNLLRGGGVDSTMLLAGVKDLFVCQGSRAWVCFPPERLEFLFRDRTDTPVDTLEGDVFGLAMVAYELLVGSIPEDRVAALNDVPADRRIEATLELQRDIRRSLARSGTLPREVSDLLAEMMAPDHRSRPSSMDVVDGLARTYDVVASRWESSGDQRHLVAFMPAESRDTVHRWDWIGRDPATDAGRVELKGFLELELRGAEVVWSPEGAEPWVSGSRTEALREAQVVLLGRRGAWFCHYLRPRSAFGDRQGVPNDKVLLIKFVVPKERARRIQERPLRRRVGSVDVVPWTLHSATSAEGTKDRPSWATVVDSTKAPNATTMWQEDVKGAVEWLVRYEAATLQARRYAYKLDDGLNGWEDEVRLRLDEGRDEAARHRSSSLLNRVAERRPSFGDFFEAEDIDEGGVSLLVEGDDTVGHPPSVVAYFREKLDDNLIQVKRSRDGGAVPAQGWVRVEADRGSRSNLDRQREVLPELFGSTTLLESLANPGTIGGLPHRWRKAGEYLDPDAPEVIRDLLVSHPFYAIQGPPGTGKTTVVAHTVATYLLAERADRVLVSAQSNDALDNVALKVLEVIEELGGKPPEELGILPWRVTSSGDSPLHPSMKDYVLETSVQRQIGYIERSTVDQLKRETGPIRDVLEDWLRALPEVEPELYRRRQRGANLVFSTCANSTQRKLGLQATGMLFDWVFIEEAARAWITELAIPMVQGLRWTLIGDPQQLGPFASEEVERFLRRWADEDPTIDQDGDRAERYLKVWAFFGELFRHRSDDQLRRPVRMLRQQFRMNEDVAELVSRVFYPDGEAPDGDLAKGLLRTAERACRPNELVAPAEIAGRSMVWLDTGDRDDCRDRPRWHNEGEARLVAGLVNDLRPRPSPPTAHGVDDLAVLTPYREQAALLRDYPGVEPFLHTVDAFQGREAETVIVSLVRSRRIGSPEQPWRSLGYLVKPERVNVMMSRARRCLVVVGNFRHFADSEVPFWRQVCLAFERYGKVQSLAEEIVTP
jgi:hypothetical protein